MPTTEHVGGLFAGAEVLLSCRADRAACIPTCAGQLAAEENQKNACGADSAIIFTAT